MQNFIYKGSVNSGVTIAGIDYLLYRDKPVTLPEDNGYVLSMIAQGFLEVVVAEENIKPVIVGSKK